MTRPRIAVVIPAYNAAESIAEAIASALGQTHPADEIIVVDDGSSDDTVAVAVASGARVIRQANAGPAAARNTGIKATDAEWIALLDADDRWLPLRLALQLRDVADPTVGLIYTGINTPRWEAPPPPPFLDFDLLWTQNRVCTSSVLLRRSAWEAVGGFREDRELSGAEDYNLWLRLAHAGWRLVGVPDRLVEYLPTESSLSMQTRRFALGELTQLRLIAAELGIDPGRVRKKQQDLWMQYGIEAFYFRDRETAREFLSAAARNGPLPWRVRLRLIATWLPLNWRPRPDATT